MQSRNKKLEMQMESESVVWAAVPGYVGLYEVSTAGRIRSLYRCPDGRRAKGRRIKLDDLCQSCAGNGYLVVSLCSGGKIKQHMVHRVVLSAFIGLQPEGMEACHNDGNRHNNQLENLRWDTRKSNHADKKIHGTQTYGENHKNAKLTNSAALLIKKRLISTKDAAELFGVKESTAKHIVKGETWRFLSV